MRELNGHDELAFISGASAAPFTRVMALVHSLWQVEDARSFSVAQEDLQRLSLQQWELFLLKFRRELFGEQVNAECQCDTCSETISLVFDISELLVDSVPPTSMADFSAPKLELRLITVADLIALEAAPLAGERERMAFLLSHLAGRSLTWAHQSLSDGADYWIRELDRCAHDLDLRLSSECAECGQPIETVFDVTDFFDEELSKRSSHVLDDIHRLAMSYHWPEQAILDLPITRRSAYLARVDADVMAAQLNQTAV